MHRLPLNIQSAIEFTAISLATVAAQLQALLDETSWERLTGRHGALFFMAIALLIFWNSTRVENKRRAEHLAKQEEKEDKRREEEEDRRQQENEAREARHREAIAIQQLNAQKFMELTVEGIKASGLVTNALNTLAVKLDGRRCGLLDAENEKLRDQIKEQI